MNIPLQCPPPLDPGFEPASLWLRDHTQACIQTKSPHTATIQVSRSSGPGRPMSVPLLPDSTAAFREQNRRIIERVLKSLLWIQGGNEVSIKDAPEVSGWLVKQYQSGGKRAFDAEFMGERCFDAPFKIRPTESIPSVAPEGSLLPHSGRLNGCRIGFDLGGSDRKCAAVIDGEVVFSEEVKWDPYFKSDPAYHRQGIFDTIQRAAGKLPRIDGIGGSAAGIYIDNEPRVASIFRGIGEADFRQHIRPLFHEVRARYKNIPFVVANDGDVTALAGSLATGKSGILGISMGTSQAVGYLDPRGRLTGWLNELAFVPVDVRPTAPVDEWSGDSGCGVQYFSQQAVGRLAKKAGFQEAEHLPLPDLLEQVQAAVAGGDDKARLIFETIGTCLGYALPWYARFYDFSNVLILGRVTSGEGGNLIIRSAQKVLETEFPELAGNIHFITTDETTKRHGQAVAAASLPDIPES